MKVDYLFEMSWEVCNKVGGIYTVVSSKAQQMLQQYGEGYFTVGPFLPEKNISSEFTEQDPPGFLKEAFDTLKNQGIVCHFGTWHIGGEPNTILLDFSGYKYKLNDIKKEYWDRYGLDTLGTQYHDFDEPFLWSVAVGVMLEEVKRKLSSKSIVTHCHEWLSGGALLYLKSRSVKVGTVFTTHATMLGRTLATQDVDIYSQLSTIDPQQKAYEVGIQAKYLTEKICAKHADAFTTVSEITGLEATHFLKKKPDVLLPNGLDTEQFPTFDEASVKHKDLKAKAKRFLTSYFFPYYQFDLDNTLIYFLAGRYEFRDKGIDIYIKALAQLNSALKKASSDRTIAAFIWVPTGVGSIRAEVLENRTFFEDIEESVEDSLNEIQTRMISGLVSGAKIDEGFLLGEAMAKQIKKKINRFKKKGTPPVCTHHLQRDDDPTISALRKSGLNNAEDDRVKVIFYPIYLTGADQLTDLNYYEAIMASHLGVFPSYYEPWGYTPLETGALGVASVTTDLAGFGRYIQNECTGKKNPGIYVLERQDKDDEDVIKQLADIFLRFANGSKQDRIENKLKAKRLADVADWKKLVKNYFKAHEMAASRVK